MTLYDIFTENSPSEDHECLMHDPISGYLYIVQKNHERASANIYKFYPEDDGISNGPALESIGQWS